ncbi:PREDICTED: uncharacterized protein LOC108747283 isoform X2 [Trachymyrmex septentrionalis]|uniref:uncharacterized protein LOC108747283 isoform X2 n=1 Tax=Trachymyrmex septentrionalis TaxID=34720 RepID=UPI00084F36A5|nr:PREDICTED: uncharacterized protein LOC108747283 isoform X2 [Trachymyrmex septentrionalis]
MSGLPSALRLTSCCYCCCCWLLLTCLVVFLIPASCTSDTPQQIISPAQKQSVGDDDAAVYESSYLDDDAEVYEDEQTGNGDLDDDWFGNFTEKGRYLGSPCDVVSSCNSELQHVFCDSITGLCECEKFYPVRLGPTKGCAKPKKLGEQCFYRATCTFADQHSTCTQVQHNAVCDCEEGYHRVALSRPNKKVFCAEDLVLITTDIPTLLCIASGIAIFTGMICFVLKLFSRPRYSRPRRYANANHAPPMLFSSDTGIPLTLHGRPSSRSSQRSSSAGPLSCAFTRRPSSGGSRGPLVPASRAGSRRPSLASVHSSTSSSRSYSARRLEKERNDKEQRQALQELRLAKQREQTQQQQQQVVPTPSPRTPHSTDELLPSVEEGKEVFYNEQVPTTSDVSDTIPTTTMTMMTTTLTTAITTSNVNTTRTGEIAPMTTPATIFGTSVAPRASDDIFQV